MRLFRDRYSHEGKGLPTPTGGVARYFVMLGTHFWRLIGLNLLFIAFMLPIITIPASYCATNRVLTLIIRNGNCFLWQDFIEEFKRSFVRSIFPALISAALLFAGYYAMSLGLSNVALWSLIFWAIGIFLTLCGICWGAYTFVLIPLLDLDNKGTMKNARLLCMINPGRALSVFVTIIGMSALAAILFPFSIIALLLIWLVLVQYTVCFLIYSMANDYILKPYEEQKTNSALTK